MAKTGIVFQELGIKTKGSVHQTRFGSSAAVRFLVLTTQFRLALGWQLDLIALWSDVIFLIREYRCWFAWSGPRAIVSNWRDVAVYECRY